MDFKPSRSSGVELSTPVKSGVVASQDSISEKPRKFILLAFRDCVKCELHEFAKWGMTVYEYSPESVNERSMAQLFEKYDVVILNMTKIDDVNFYSLSRGDPALEAFTIHTCSLCGKRRRSDRDCERYGIQSQLKKFLTVKTLAEFIQYLIIGDPKKARPEWQDFLIKIGEGCMGFCR